ncbi:serine/threonine-protein kinase 31 isoform X2 [Protopterus annectens]|uniref:serine/threonine-protein kinase 31 isoform X2 n=1 Tax=Protopterus annectens TaxID=7888 RepID=UPI001CF9583C|nr:serine/threonine-protein kinase 31 isoform X2 [Protopterus annectens]
MMMDVVRMDGEVVQGKAEKVFGSHAEDAVTFWAQDINTCKELMNLSRILEEVCPLATPVFGTPDLNKCVVTYIDYGNSEVLKRGTVVELAEDLQYPGLANKYRLWGLQIPLQQDVMQFDKGRKYLYNMIYEKLIRIQHRGVYCDGTILVQAECNDIDIGEEVAKKCFAEKCKPTFTSENEEQSASHSWSPALYSKRQTDTCQKGDKKVHQFNKQKGRIPFYDQKGDVKRDCQMGRRMPEFNASYVNMLKSKPDQKLVEEICNLKFENKALHENFSVLELEIRKLKLEAQYQKEGYTKQIEELQNSTKSAVEKELHGLASKVATLRKVRGEHLNDRFGDLVSNGIRIVSEGYLSSPQSLEALDRVWEEYSLAQETLRLCEKLDDIENLVNKRNEVCHQLYAYAKEFIDEVDHLPIVERMDSLKELCSTLESTYGPTTEEDDLENIFDQFSEWKNEKLEEYSNIRCETDSSLHMLCSWLNNFRELFDLSVDVAETSDEVAGNVGVLLNSVEVAVSKELTTSLTEQSETDKMMILKAYTKVMQNIKKELQLLSSIEKKYFACTEFKLQIVEWLTKTPDVGQLLSIKKTIKGLKAQLRLKIVEKNNFEESDECDHEQAEKLKEEIAVLRNRVFHEINKEMKEYELLSSLVEKWFPELPLLHPEAGILKFMNSAGLLSSSLERDLLETVPLKELSRKRPLLCCIIQDQKFILKGYSVDNATEAKVVERAARYHKAWSNCKEDSGLLHIMFLFFCKSDPVAYIMVPFYPDSSLKMVQDKCPLTPLEVAAVMKGVAKGLHTLHASSITHGSLHPNNVFVVNRKQGIVGDFDFSKDLGQRSSEHWMLAEKLSILSPEVKNGHLVSSSSDMYTYGCLLLWLLLPNHDFIIQSDGLPEIGAVMDEKMKDVVSKLICTGVRLTAAQVLEQDCFILTELNPAEYDVNVPVYSLNEQPESVSSLNGPTQNTTVEVCQE